MGQLNKEQLLQEIRAKGVEISSIDELMKIGAKDRDLVPILLNHLSQISDESDKEFIVRCLGVKGFAEVSKPLLYEFNNSDNLLYKWAIGNTLDIISDKGILPELLEIVQNKKHGRSRQMIIYGLGKYKKETQIKPILVSLLQDKDVAGHAIHALSQLGDPEVIKDIKPFENYDVTWIRNEAKRAVKKLEIIKNKDIG